MMLALLALAGWWGWNRLPPNWADGIKIAAPAEPHVVNAAPTATAPPLLVAAPPRNRNSGATADHTAPAPVAPPGG